MGNKARTKGKTFEREFKKSAENQDLLCVRFNDTDLSYNYGKQKDVKSRFTSTNPADYLIYKYPYVYFIECKSTLGSSISFEIEEGDKALIHLHQIRDLANVSLYYGVYGLFVFNFRVEKEGEPYSEKTYCMDIRDFCKFYSKTDKKSINKFDIIEYGGFEIDAKQRRKLYDYDIKGMLDKLIELKGEQQ